MRPFANQGTYNTPVLYTTVKDSNGNVLLSNKKKSRKVIKKSTAWLLTNAMEDVVKKGTGGPWFDHGCCRQSRYYF